MMHFEVESSDIVLHTFYSVFTEVFFRSAAFDPFSSNFGLNIKGLSRWDPAVL